jgi:hypothetical protein
VSRREACQVAVWGLCSELTKGRSLGGERLVLSGCYRVGSGEGGGGWSLVSIESDASVTGK